MKESKQINTTPSEIAKSLVTFWEELGTLSKETRQAEESLAAKGILVSLPNDPAELRRTLTSLLSNNRDLIPQKEFLQIPEKQRGEWATEQLNSEAPA